MSYKPSSKSGYGDKDYTEDTWLPEGVEQNHVPSAPGHGWPSQPIGQAQNSVIGQRDPAAGRMSYVPGQNPQYANNTYQGQQNANPIAAFANSITQEDILLMRGWQRDSFYYRVLPCEVIALGSLYMYTKKRGLPHSIPKYLGMSFAAFMLGKWLYRDEFKRRLAESRSTTPYMQALRKSLGVAPAVSSEFTNSAFGSGGGSDNDLDQWSLGGGGALISRTDDRQQSELGGPQSTDYNLSGSDRLDNQTIDGSAKPRVTYDELRARNRGYIK